MHKSFRKYRILCCLLVPALWSCSAAKDPTGTAISNVTVIDARSGVRTGQTVLFDGDRIREVGPAESVSRAAEYIDGTGKFLIPGLWDMHVHLTYDERFTDAMPEAFIRYGITSVRDTGGLMHKLLPVVEKMRAENAIAPRVYFSGPLLDGQPVVYDGVSRPEIGTGNVTEDQARVNVLELKEQGVDFIKIYEMVTPEVFAALVEEATSNDLPIAAHVPLTMRASQAAPFVDSMEHLRNVELDCAANAEQLQQTRLQRLAERAGESGYTLRGSLHSLQRTPAIAVLDERRCAGVLATMRDTIQVPTTRLNALPLYPPQADAGWKVALSESSDEVIDDWGALPDFMATDVSERDTLFARYTLEMIARMFAAGVPIGAGTDTPIAYALPGYSLHRELELLVQAGMPPIEALRSATVRPAEFLGLENEMGSIEPGMRADLVLLNADPLSDIRNTRAIRQVILRGRVVER